MRRTATTLAALGVAASVVAWASNDPGVGTERAAATRVALQVPPLRPAVPTPPAPRGGRSLPPPNGACFRVEPGGPCFEVCTQFIRPTPSVPAPPALPRRRGDQRERCDRYPDAVGRMVPLTRG